MQIRSIEPTPSPLTMKITVEEQLPDGIRQTYDAKQAAETPEPLNRLLSITGVRSLYRAADFIALDRTAKGDWQHILSEVKAILGVAAGQSANGKGIDEQPAAAQAEGDTAAAFGEVKVLLQHFRGIPLQIRVDNGAEQSRAALPQRFADAAVKAAAAAPNLIKERSLIEWDTRYGALDEVLEEVVQELDATYNDERLELLIGQAEHDPSAANADAGDVASSGRVSLSYEETERQLRSPDWKQRYAALQQIEPSKRTLPLLLIALEDERAAIRRLAAVYIGDLKEQSVLPYLYQALRDDSPAVRRTAGDTLSDIGDPAAQEAMAEALKDPNRLVRWRAARFLYEVGDESVLPALQAAADDPEFEVRMQVRMALERIEGGHAAEGSVWQQMTKRDQN